MDEETVFACIVGHRVLNTIIVDTERADWPDTERALLEMYDEVVDVRELPSAHEGNPVGVGWERDDFGLPFSDRRTQ